MSLAFPLRGSSSAPAATHNGNASVATYELPSLPRPRGIKLMTSASAGPGMSHDRAISEGGRPPSRLDQSVERARVRGIEAAHTLSDGEHRILDALLEAEASSIAFLDEASLQVACSARRGIKRWRFQASLTKLLSGELIRRERSTIRITVAGVAAFAVQRASAWDDISMPRLRNMRRSEIGTL